MELIRALAAFAEPPRSETGRLADLLDLGRAPTREEFADLFLFELFPYASVYLGDTGMMGGEPRDRIAGFWRALGQSPPPEPDHLVVMLALYARLVELEEESNEEERESWRRVRGTFFWEHLESWMSPFLNKAKQVGPEPYRRWAALLEEWLEQEARVLPQPEGPSMHLRSGVPDRESTPDELGEFDELGDLVRWCLTPQESGMIITRSDLARAARELELGLRIGERSWVLQSLLEQDVARVIGWLSREAASWAGRHTEVMEKRSVNAGVWARRARVAERVLQVNSPESGGN